MKSLLTGLCLILLVAGCATGSLRTESNSGAAQKVMDETPLEWSGRLADSEIERRGDSLVWRAGGKAKWSYETGLFTLALLKLSEATEEGPNKLDRTRPVLTNKYATFSRDVIGSFITDTSEIHTYNRTEYQLDSLNEGKSALALWRLTGDARYRGAALVLRFQLTTQPRTYDGGFWHKQRYKNQMWLDGAYMAAPFYAECGQVFEEPGAYNDAATQLRLIDLHTYDSKSGLNCHGWDADRDQPWADPVTGCSSNFWGRAEGWYAMALVDTLDYLPQKHPARERIIATLQKTARGILRWQDPQSGLWWQVMDQGGRPGNYLEASASAMFVYALAKGINHGYLPKSDVPAVEKGYAGIVKNLIKDDGGNRWSLTQCCAVSGLGGSASNGKMRDGSFDYYVHEPVVTNDLKAVGAFILAGTEMQRL